MAATIKIKRSTGNTTPTLVAGELAYSAALSANTDAGAGVLYIGNPATGTNIEIGGTKYTSLLTATPGTAAASKAVILDASAGISGLGAVSANTLTATSTLTSGNVQISTNTVSTTGSNENLNLNPNGTGKVQIAGTWALPREAGTTGYVLTANTTSGVAEWLESSSTLNISGNANTGNVNLLTQTLAITGSGGISTDVSGNSIALSLSSSLTSLAGLSVTANDLIIGTGANTFVTQATSEIGRALLNTANTATAQATLALVPGTNVQAYDAGLQALANKTSTGIMVQTGNDTFTSVTIQGTANNIVVNDGSGTGGNPTIDLAAVTNSGTGTFQKVTVDSYGRVTGTTNVVIGDIEALANNTYLRLDGAFAMTGNLDMGANNLIRNVGTAVLPNDAANKAYVDNAVAGLSWKQAVQASSNTTTSITLNGTQTVDGISITPNKRVLLTGQSPSTDNGIWVSAAGPWSRASDADPAEELNGAAVFVLEGTQYANTGWTQTAELTSFAGQVWTQFAGGGAVTGGTGISVVGAVVNFNAGAGLTTGPNNTIEVKTDNSNNAVQIVSGNANTVELVLASGSGLSQTGSGLTVAAGGVTNAMLANSSIGISGNTGTPFTVSLGSGASIVGDGTITTAAAGNTVTVSVATATDSVLGVASFSSASFDVTAGAVSVKTAGISNAMLANSSVSLAGDQATTGSVALGGTATINGTAAQGIVATVNGSIFTITANNASTTDKGVASFSADNFSVASGVVSIKAGGVDLLTEVANTLPVANGGTGANTFTAGQLLVGNGTSPFATSANLAFDSANNALTVGTAVITGGTVDVTIAATGANGDINLVPQGSGTVNIGASGAGTIASSSGQTLTVTGDAGLTLAATSNDIVMTVAAGDTAKVTVAGANAIQYSTNLDNADLVNKYFVENVAVIDGGTY